MEGYWGGGSSSYEEPEVEVEPKIKLVRFKNLKWFQSSRGILFSGELFDDECIQKDIVWVTNCADIRGRLKQAWSYVTVEGEVLDYSNSRYKIIAHSIVVSNTPDGENIQPNKQILIDTP